MSTRLAATLLIIAIDLSAVLHMVDRPRIPHANHPHLSKLDRTERVMDHLLAKLSPR